jgi:NADH-quinone oxidoreductase subunit J
MPLVFFYLFSALAVAGAIALVSFRNPVTSAMWMVVSFIGMAALFILLNAYFVGIIQVLVYTGAIMVLFLFIIMLLDVKFEERVKARPAFLAAGIIIPVLFMIQLTGVLQKTPDETSPPLALNEAAEHFAHRPAIRASLADEASPTLPDVHLVGDTLFSRHNFPLQVIGVLLLVATVGVVALSRKASARPQPAPDNH